MTYEAFKLFGMKQASFYDTDAGRRARTIELPVIHKTPLQLWVEVSNFIYSIHPLTSVEALFAMVPPETDIVVIGDMRRVCEAEYISARGGACYQVTRPGREPISNIDAELIGWKGWAGSLSNCSDFSNLELQVRGVCEGLVAEC